MSTALGYCLLDAAGRVVAESDAQRPYYAASTIKLTVMAAVARRIDAGELDWSDTLEVRSLFESGVTGAPPFAVAEDDRDDRMPPDGERMTVRELVMAMIRRSSNEATNLLIPVVGLAAIAAVHDDAEATGCRLERLIGDTAARDAGATNEVTPLGLARLLHRIVTGSLASLESTAVMIEALRGQEYPCIAEVLPAGTVWGSKSGWVPGIEHDAAFIGTPGDDGLRVLAVCTEGFADREARPEIHRVTTALITDFNGM